MQIQDATIFLHIIREDEQVYGRYLVPEFAERHLVAIYSANRTSRAFIQQQPISAIDEQRVIIEGWRVGVDEPAQGGPSEQAMGMSPLYYTRVSQLRIGEQGELLGTIEINQTQYTVVYHAFTLSWYLETTALAYYYEGHPNATGEDYQRASQPAPEPPTAYPDFCFLRMPGQPEYADRMLYQAVTLTPSTLSFEFEEWLKHLLTIDNHHILAVTLTVSRLTDPK